MIKIKTLDKIFQNLKKCQNIRALAIVGSFLQPLLSDSKNIDLFLVVEKKFGVRLLLEQAFKTDSCRRNINATISDDAIQLKISGVTISFVQFLPEILTARLKEICNGGRVSKKRRAWCFGWWVPEGFCGDVFSTKVLFDKDGLLSYWKEKLEEYPKKLKKRIISHSNANIKNKLAVLSKIQNQKAKDTLLMEIFFDELRALFAINEEYFKGVSSIKERIKGKNTT